MDFSETYRFSGPVPVCSPNGKYIAAATEYRLVVRDALTTQVVQIYSCVDKISDVQWCPNSTYIMCGLVKRAIVQVWSVPEPGWTCKIDEGLAGAEAVQWSPDGLHILVTADFQIRCMLPRRVPQQQRPDQLKNQLIVPAESLYGPWHQNPLYTFLGQSMPPEESSSVQMASTWQLLRC